MALVLLMATGCAKEEVVAPTTVRMVSKKTVNTGNSTGTSTSNTLGNGGTGQKPITDDGDDMGDKERTTKPR